VLRTSLGVALAALAVTAAAHARSDATCLTTARAAVKTTKVLAPNLAGGRTRVTPRDVAFAICFDFTRDGRRDIAFTVYSGGTAGDIAWVVLLRQPASWQVAGFGGGYKLGLARIGRDVVVTQPVYKKNDPNCCPTGGFDHQAYRWNGVRFALVRSWHNKTFKP
jgi:hypothetical protein